VSNESPTPTEMSLCDAEVLDRDLHREVYCRSSCAQELRDSMEQCRIVLMDDNRLAIAPDAACAGDVVCLLPCGQSLCVLRPHQDLYWKLISGDCHVFGSDKFLDEGNSFEVPIFPYAMYCKENEHRMEVFTIC
jgi:hypothetical protein